jgi:uncharacterized protein (DUF433 family)
MQATTDRITKIPNVCGGDACIRGHRIPVWGLVEVRRLGASSRELLEAYPSLTGADLEAAWEYALSHRLEIERNIWENQAIMEGQGGDRRLALIVRGRQLGFSDEAIADGFSPAMSAVDVRVALSDYRLRQQAIDAALPVLLPAELREGLEIDGRAVR